MTLEDAKSIWLRDTAVIDRIDHHGDHVTVSVVFTSLSGHRFEHVKGKIRDIVMRSADVGCPFKCGDVIRLGYDTSTR